MSEEIKKEILMDIIINGHKYIIEDTLDDADFKKHRELVLSPCSQYDYIKYLILKYGYTTVNDTLLLLLDFSTTLFKKRDELAALVEDLNAGYDADPEQAPKELERMCDLCARAADYLEELS